MPELEQETTGRIYEITSEFMVAKVWVKSRGSSVTLEHPERGTTIVETQNQDKLVPHASQISNLTFRSRASAATWGQPYDPPRRRCS
jgi:hypothetical protein